MLYQFTLAKIYDFETYCKFILAITNTGSNCELFNGQCTIQTGFSITIDTSC